MAVVVKGWRVFADVKGKREQISRLYHSHDAALEYAKLAGKSGYQNVDVETTHGYDRLEEKI